MAIEKVQELLKAIKNDPKAQELLKNLPPVKSEEEKIASLIGVAKKLGYDLTKEDFEAYAQAQKEKTDAQAEAVQTLADEDVAQASGGKREHDKCFQTYKDRENCAFYDACDMAWRHYGGYKCQWISRMNE